MVERRNVSLVLTRDWFSDSGGTESQCSEDDTKTTEPISMKFYGGWDIKLCNWSESSGGSRNVFSLALTWRDRELAWWRDGLPERHVQPRPRRRRDSR